MRCAAAFQVFLLCLCWTRAQGESGGLTENDIIQTEDQALILGVKATSDQTNITPDIWAELMELRDLLIQHSVELRNSKSKIEKLEQENTAIQTRLTASESKNADLLARVTATENKNTVLEARLNIAENMVEELKRENNVLEARMSSSKLQVEELKRENAEQPKVAFSVGLTDTGPVGPFSKEIILKFSKIFTNIGQAYDPTTGVFTAPVRGAYYFRFNGFDQRSSNWMGIDLHHNGNRITLADDINDNHGYVSVSHGFVLQLEKGDTIYMFLPSGYGVYDDGYNRTTFSGFLLFSM